MGKIVERLLCPVEGRSRLTVRIMAEVAQQLFKRPRVEEITTNVNAATPTIHPGDMSALVPRPTQRGTKGDQISAVTNQYILTIAPTTQFFQYTAIVTEKDGREHDPVDMNVCDLDCQQCWCDV